VQGTGTGTAVGSSTALAVGASIAGSVGAASGASTALGVGFASGALPALSLLPDPGWTFVVPGGSYTARFSGQSYTCVVPRTTYAVVF
jgi:hypothetical protein